MPLCAVIFHGRKNNLIVSHFCLLERRGICEMVKIKCDLWRQSRRFLSYYVWSPDLFREEIFDQSENGGRWERLGWDGLVIFCRLPYHPSKRTFSLAPPSEIVYSYRWGGVTARGCPCMRVTPLFPIRHRLPPTTPRRSSTSSASPSSSPSPTTGRASRYRLPQIRRIPAANAIAGWI